METNRIIFEEVQKEKADWMSPESQRKGHLQNWGKEEEKLAQNASARQASSTQSRENILVIAQP